MASTGGKNSALKLFKSVNTEVGVGYVLH